MTSAATTPSMSPLNVIFSGTLFSLSHGCLLRNDAVFCDRDRVITRELCRFYRVSFRKWHQKTNNDRPFFNRFTPL